MNSDIQEAVRIMKNGGIILYPTDTIWGIGCDATNQKAVERIFRLKQRAETKAMLVLLDEPAMLDRYMCEVPSIAWQLIDATEATDKPLTVIYPNAKNLAHNLIAEDGSVGIRITSEAFSKALCAGMRRPVVSTSANISGQPAAASFTDIADEIKNGVDYICQYRQQEHIQARPSSIIKIGTDNTFSIIRQ